MGTSNGNGSTREVEQRLLPVKLTEPELLKRGDEMADAEVEIEKLKLDRKALNASIEIVVKRRAMLGHAIDRGSEDREVRCHWQEDFAKNVFRLVRQDTGDEVDTRPMTATDRMGSLPFDGARDKAAAHSRTPKTRKKPVAAPTLVTMPKLVTEFAKPRTRTRTKSGPPTNNNASA
jgi:hypothetical protein